MMAGRFVITVDLDRAEGLPPEIDDSQIVETKEGFELTFGDGSVQYNVHAKTRQAVIRTARIILDECRR